jgi:hypothetical protein
MAGLTGRLAAAVAGILLTSAAGAAQPGREVVAEATSPAGTFAARSPAADEFTVLPQNAPLLAGDLLVTLPGAAAKGKNGAVALTSLADYDGKSPLPILETAFTLHDPENADLDVTLDRGRIDLTNTKPAGPATVRVRFWGQDWKITLDDPGTRVALEIVGRWPPGARFKVATGADPKPAPVASLVLLVLKGEAVVDVGGTALGMKTPPGPALLEWDSVGGVRAQPLKLEQLPDWADPTATRTEDGKKAAAAVERFRQARVENPGAAVRSFLDSADPVGQRVGLVTAGALDDLDTLVRVIGGAKPLAQWEFAVTVLRHWLGRRPGQDQRLYDTLTSPAQGYTPTQAKIILQLLFGFSPDDLRQPETYEVLIDYLAHDQAAIRNLAAWHLVRMVPQGRAIPVRPAATRAEYEAAYREWKKLVPAGQLPPGPEKE